MPNFQSFYSPPEGLFEFIERNFENRLLSHQHIVALGQHRSNFYKKGSEPPFGPGPFDGVADLFTGYETDPAATPSRYRKEYKSGVVPALAGLVDPVEIGGTLEGFEVDQTANRLRPFARRALIILRPFFVFIRVRKPWVLLRGVLCG